LLTFFNFYVVASFWIESGWLVRVICCREGDDNLSIPPNGHYIDEKKLRLPYVANGLVISSVEPLKIALAPHIL
jgi:hypothetical protein